MLVPEPAHVDAATAFERLVVDGSPIPPASARRATPRMRRALCRSLLGLAVTALLSTFAGVSSRVHVEVQPATVQASVTLPGDTVPAATHALSQPRAAAPAIVTVTATHLNLRAGPGTNYRVLGSVPGGTKLKILQQQSGWYKVQTPKGVIGWSSSRYVSAGAAAKPASKQAPRAQSTAAPASARKSGGVVQIAMQYVGYPYVWGADGPNAFDCSGFTQYVYKQVGVQLPRPAAAQFSTKIGQRIGSLGALAAGDLVFFKNTGGRSGITHVGIYVGGGKMVAANNPGSGVQVTPITASYWSERFVGGIRPYR
jgi:cell wall-associated NlpC family hydrolase